MTVVLTVLTLVLVAGGCRPPGERGSDGPYQVTVHLSEASQRVGPATIEVELLHDGAPADGARVRVTGDMTHAGMVPVIDDAVPLGGGRYRTRAFVFDMAGDWILTVDATFADGTRRQASVPVRVTR